MKKILSKLIPDKIKKHYYELGREDALKGDNVYCNCCKKSFITFLPFGHKKRPNALCPCCGSLERHRLIWFYLEKYTDVATKPAKLLHIAPEKIFFDKFNSLKNVDYVCGDLSPENYTYAKNIIKLDITKLPFENNTFDIVFCSHVLEHIPDDVKAMKEIYRIMKPNAWAILQVPIDYKRETTYEDFSITTPEGREKAFGLSDHVRVYGKDYSHKLEKSGFAVKEINILSNLNEEEIFKFGFLYENIHVVSKKNE